MERTFKTIAHVRVNRQGQVALRHRPSKMPLVSSNFRQIQSPQVSFRKFPCIRSQNAAPPESKIMRKASKPVVSNFSSRSLFQWQHLPSC